MFDSYYCIKMFCRLKTLEKMLRKVLFSCTCNGAERHVTCKHFKNATSRANDNFISFWHHEVRFATVHVTDDDVKFCEGLWNAYIRKTAKPCINSMRTALLIHGFVPVKTWLLIASDTAFYAIIQSNEYEYSVFAIFYGHINQTKLDDLNCSLFVPVWMFI